MPALTLEEVLAGSESRRFLNASPQEVSVREDATHRYVLMRLLGSEEEELLFTQELSDNPSATVVKETVHHPQKLIFTLHESLDLARGKWQLETYFTEQLREYGERSFVLDIEKLSMDGYLDLLDFYKRELSHLASVRFSYVGFLNYGEINSPIYPDESSFSAQWNLHNIGPANGISTAALDADIDAPEAWAIQSDAVGVKVGIVDSGILKTHREFNPSTIQDYTEIGGTPVDSHGHGTAVAGVIAAGWGTWDDTPQNGYDLAGVAKGTTLISVKATNTSGMNEFDANRGIKEAIARGARIVNCSFSFSTDYEILNATVRDNPDVIFVCSAGNNGTTLKGYPAAYADQYPNVISVGASTEFDQPAPGSSYGATVTLFAPGGDFDARDPTDPGAITPCDHPFEIDCQQPGDIDSVTMVRTALLAPNEQGTYSAFGATSAAAPHVTGTLALMKAYYYPSQPMSAAIAADLVTRLKNSVDLKIAYNHKCVTKGRLNARRSLSRFSHEATSHSFTSPAWRYVFGDPGGNGFALGWINDTNYPWIFHEDFGDVYVDTGDPLGNELYLYSPVYGQWALTYTTMYDWFWVFDLNNWVHHDNLWPPL